VICITPAYSALVTIYIGIMLHSFLDVFFSSTLLVSADAGWRYQPL